ncbi:uncharacterized protein [Henckelia pumila]|uniref:uncharacterized protein n=1 Tax=Henckelia pumila TaxID=405737 RepID=UPI003C6DEFA7
MTKGRLTECDSSGSHKYDRSKSRSKKKNIYCFKCGGKGHFKRECTKSIEKGSKENVASTSGGGEILFSETATEVRHVKGLTNNLLSLGKLDDIGCKTRIEKGIIKIVKGALVAMKAKKVAANLYVLLGETHKETKLAVASIGSGEESTVLWHRKLGHMSEQGMKMLSERKLLPRLTKLTLPFCEHCVTMAIDLKTPMDMWTGKSADYSWLHTFGSPVDVIFEEDKVKGYKDKLNSETTIIQVENKTDEDQVFCEAVPEHKEQEPFESEVSKVRQATRERGPPGWLSDYFTESNIAYCLLKEDVRVVLVMCAVFDLHLEQLDVKTEFLHGDLEEEIYMLHPEDFAEKGKENLTRHCTSSGSSQSVYGESWQEHWSTVKMIFRYINGTSDAALCFGGSDFKLRGYVDSVYAGDLDKRKSTTSYVFTVAGGAVSWVSKVQTVVALSTIEAEYMTATQACKEAIWIKRLLEELGHKQEKILLFCDSQSALHITKNPAFHSKTKHIGVQFHFVRKVVEEGSLDMKKIHTKDNMADIMTKPVSTEKFEWCRSSCGLA